MNQVCLEFPVFYKSSVHSLFRVFVSIVYVTELFNHFPHHRLPALFYYATNYVYIKRSIIVIRFIHKYLDDVSHFYFLKFHLKAILIIVNFVTDAHLFLFSFIFLTI